MEVPGMRTDASAFLAAERQEPLTAADHAEAFGHQDEYARDVPRTCICTWSWNVQERRYERIATLPRCPWDTPQASS
jgi:hypothetical protein